MKARKREVRRRINKIVISNSLDFFNTGAQ
jgi:hypothetical protein